MLLIQRAVVVVFLIACANVANLLLVRAARRLGEMSVRAALGASRWRVVRQLLVESGVLAAIAVLAGVGLSQAVLRWLNVAQNPLGLTGLPDLTMDWVVLVFVAGVTMVIVAFGLAPVPLFFRMAERGVMKGSGGHVGGTYRARRWTSALIVAELALTVTLLAAAGMMVRAFLSESRIDPGVEPASLLTLRVSMPQSTYEAVAARTTFFEQIEQRLGGVSAVEASTIATRAPLEGGTRRPLAIEGRPDSGGTDTQLATVLLVGDAYFDTLGVPLLRGRAFTQVDGLSGQQTAIVNRRFAALFFPGEDPLGRRIRVTSVNQPGDLADAPWLTIVGISPDIRQMREARTQVPVLYRPHRTESPSNSVLIVRAAGGDPARLTPLVREAASGIDPDMSFFFVWTMEELLFERLTESRYLAWGGSTVALLALLLSGVGLYAVTSYAATQRTQEIGLRVALGATWSQVQWVVLRQALQQLGVGLTIGVTGALGVGLLIEASLFEASTLDATTLVSIVAILAGMAVSACIVPTLRALRLDPVAALRHE